MEKSNKYQELSMKVNTKITVIKRLLTRHKKREKSNDSWGLVGDLAYINELLEQIKTHLEK